ncbi:hypothetical protein HMPREF1008_01112 [Olsenella sp. oral taxon 809 str. F0356]|uniref:DUF4013 domain-containing protein n=1 Tax=Olsenella sp. oral taxon 809 TaxID=661086 RepID=UPI000231EDFB|nr:DUF4013 domain-containing protein [Olsenella sp. oral taxon 809]EHF02017.1 hypothetical protein HMPREF1008_01112 [Olsenella sp. oral taxon 809 str. F0356]
MAEGKGYFSRSWALIGKEPGWYKVPLVMGIANFVPIAGPLGTSGYVFEWSRLIAWGADAAPKRRGIGVGECIKSGWRGFASTIGWGVLLGIIMSLVASISHGGVVPFLLSLVIGVFGGTILAVCCVRAAIYQNFKAGYRADRIFEMLKRDFGGIARIAGLCILISLIIALAVYLIALIAFIPLITRAIGMAAYTSAYSYSPYLDDSYFIYNEIISMITGMIPMMLVIGYLGSVATSFAGLVEYAAVGLWMRQFNVPAWGASGDPLPQDLMLPGATADPVVPVDPTAGDGSVVDATPVDTADSAAEVVTPLDVPAAAAPVVAAAADAAAAPVVADEEAPVVEDLTAVAPTTVVPAEPAEDVAADAADAATSGKPADAASDAVLDVDADAASDVEAASGDATDEGTTL